MDLLLPCEQPEQEILDKIDVQAKSKQHLADVLGGEVHLGVRGDVGHRVGGGRGGI